MWSEKLGHQHREGLSKAEHDAKERSLGVKSLEGFRRLLGDRFGSTLAGWRCVLDPELRGRLTLGDFRDGLQRLGGLTGNLKQLWTEFDSKNRGFVLFEDYDADVKSVLDEFRFALLDRFPSLTSAWHQGLDTDGLEQLNEAFFAESCAEMELGWEPKKVRRLYRLLLPERNSGRKLLQMEDLRLLLLPVPDGDRRALWKGSPSASTSTAQREVLSQILAQRREEFGLDSTPEDFRKLLKRMFGSVYTGWVKYLDVAQEGRLPMGRVPMGHFVTRSKAIGIAGNVRSLFQALDTSGVGYITLQDLDPETAAAVSSLLKLAKEKYGSLSAAWDEVFDTNKSGRVSEPEFSRGCCELSYPGDARRLYELIRPEAGRGHLLLSDLGPEAAAEARKRGPASSAKVARRRAELQPPPLTLPRADSEGSLKSEASTRLPESPDRSKPPSRRRPRHVPMQQEGLEWEEPLSPSHSEVDVCGASMSLRRKGSKLSSLGSGSTLELATLAKG